MKFFAVVILINLLSLDNNSIAQQKVNPINEDSIRNVVFPNGKYGFISSDGKKVIDGIYEYARDFNNGYALVQLDGKRFYINTKNQNLFNQSFDELNDFSNEFACVSKKDSSSPSGFLSGFINTNGKLIQPCIYPYYFRFENNRALVTITKNNQFYIDTTGKVLNKLDSINPNYYLTDNLVTFSKNDKFGIINTKGDTVSAAAHKYIYPIKENKKFIRLDKVSKWGLIDTTGRIIIKYIYEYISEFSNGIALVQKNGLYGYIDLKGKILIPIKLKFAIEFSEGLALIKENKTEKYVFINAKGKVVIPNIYDSPETTFKKGLLKVLAHDSKKVRTAYLNKRGKLIFL
jgi:hypothetical protein